VDIFTVNLIELYEEFDSANSNSYSVVSCLADFSAEVGWKIFPLFFFTGMKADAAVNFVGEVIGREGVKGS
jgi:hypothetical protein